MRIIFIGVVTVLASCGRDLSPVSPAVEYNSRTDGLICGADSRAPIPNLTFPRGAVGRIPGCTATIIATNKILTAAHCLSSGLPDGGPAVPNAPGSVVFEPQLGIPGAPTQTASGVRITRGRDSSDGNASGDWAIVTLNTDLQALLGSNYQQMHRVIPATAPFAATLFGYHKSYPDGGTDLYESVPATETCSANVVQNGMVYHNCDTNNGGSGGPLWRLNGGIAELVGVSAHHANDFLCVGTNGNASTSGLMYALAPDNAGGIAAARTSNGRTIVFASDKDWSLVATRQHATTSPGSSFTPWNALDSAASGTKSKMAAVTLENGNQQVWLIESQNLKTKWQSCTDGCWSAWNSHSTPAPVRDVATSGAAGVTTHLFILDTSNRIWASHKLGNWSSAWSAWVLIGTRSGAKAIAAVAFGGTNQVFVAYGGSIPMYGGLYGGAETAWGSNGSYTGLASLFLDDRAWLAIAAGTLQDGRVSIVAADNFGGLSRMDRELDGSAWSLVEMPLPLPDQFGAYGFDVLAAAREIDGKFHLLGIANGEIFSRMETTPTGTPPAPGSVTFGNWTRFYK